MTTLKSALRRLSLIAFTALSLPAGAFADELNIYNWGEYINPAVLQKFEDETKIKVNLSTYSSNEEMLAKIQGGASGYDIVFPSVHMQDIMSKLDLLAPRATRRANIACPMPSARSASSTTARFSARISSAGRICWRR